MGIREDWESLAKELGFDFRPGIEAMFQMKNARSLVEEQGQNWEQAQQAFNSTIARAVLQKFFLGMAVGSHRNHEVFLLRQSTGGKSQSFRTRFSLILPRSLDIGLQVYPERWTGRLSKLFGAQDVILGSPEFDPKAMIKAKQPNLAKQLLAGEKIQKALLALFALGGDCRLDDFGVVHREHGDFPTKERSLAVLDRLVEVADALPPKISYPGERSE